jgi:hypothetical protein
MAEAQATPRRITAAERRRQALELKKGGATYDVIARTVGYRSASGAHQAVAEALKQIRGEHVDEVRTIELARLEQMQMALWPAIAATTTPLAERVKAIDSVLRIMARRAAMLGIDAPFRVDIAEDVRRAAKDQGLSDEDADEAVRYAVELGRQLSAARNS